MRLELRSPVINYSRDRYRVPYWSWASCFSLIQHTVLHSLFSGAPTLSDLLESKHNANNMPRLIIITDEDAMPDSLLYCCRGNIFKGRTLFVSNIRSFYFFKIPFCKKLYICRSFELHNWELSCALRRNINRLNDVIQRNLGPFSLNEPQKSSSVHRQFFWLTENC